MGLCRSKEPACDALAKFLYRLASCRLTRRIKNRGILRLLKIFAKYTLYKSALLFTVAELTD
jgi:hypothetical protein